MSKNRILVVEDDKAISDAIAVNLQYSGYDYTVFDHGQEAADSLKDDHGYDLALLDVMLPGIDGFELHEHIKAYNIPVIYITAKSDTPSEIRGLRDGAEDYIVKPFDVLTLLVRIEKVLERMGKLNKILRIADIILDLENRTVIKGDTEIMLKPLEFEVFAMLAKFKNRTILREKMLNEIWGVDFFGDTHTIDVHIATLRKKLDAFDLIKTVPKYGYRLEVK
jgi:DNA-binding response OmpR family regulator